MNKIYLLLGGGVVFAVLAAYWAGGRVAHEKCRADTAIRSGNVVVETVQKNQEKQRKINEETLSAGVRDIRLFLRTRYTVGD